MLDTKRRRGHAPIGQKAHGCPSFGGAARYTMAAAVSRRGGVAHWIFEGAMTSELFEIFVCQFVMPKLPYPCVLMMDNLAAHLSPRLFIAVRDHGHALLRRPVCSPDFAPVETVFSMLKSGLRSLSYVITSNTLENAAEAVLYTIPSENFARAFEHCGYI